jgi:predicted glycoside hydrolase/deacetylase ChbG (UPF0249 family)
LILSADDFGLSPGVSRAILELIARGRIQATSVMVVYPDSRSAMAELKTFRGSIDIGLHIVLTHRSMAKDLLRSSRQPTFARVWLLSHLGLLDGKKIRTELESQFQEFRQQFGFEPDFIDGHQHVHQLPQVREILVDIINAQSRLSYVRISQGPSVLKIVKNSLSKNRNVKLKTLLKSVAGVWALTVSSQRFKQLCIEYQVATNSLLLGHYAYHSTGVFEYFYKLYLGLASSDSVKASREIYVCHPGYCDEELRRRDRLVDSREECVQFLLSEESRRLANSARVPMSRFQAPQ